MNYNLLILIIILIKSTIIVNGNYEYGFCKLRPISQYLTGSFIGDVEIHKAVGSNQIEFQFNIYGIGLNDSSYGVKIMRYGSPATDLGEVYNPNNITNENNCPSTNKSNYRVGDLNDIILINGQYNQSVKYSLPQLSGVKSIIGRAIAFYNLPLCNSNSSSNPNASILSTCIIGIGNGNLSQTINRAYNGTNIARASKTEFAKGQVTLEATTNINASVSGFTVFNSAKRNGLNGIEILGVFINLDSSTPHGIHIHTFGDISKNDGSSIGEHWSNNSQVHSLPDSTNRHWGDLGNICSYDSNFHLAYYYYFTNYFGSINNIFGRSLSIHKSQDFGNKNMGGPRILQGVIALVNPFNQNNQNIIPDRSKFKYDNICKNGTYNGFNFI